MLGFVRVVRVSGTPRGWDAAGLEGAGTPRGWKTGWDAARNLDVGGIWTSGGSWTSGGTSRAGGGDAAADFGSHGGSATDVGSHGGTAADFGSQGDRGYTTRTLKDIPGTGTYRTVR